MKKLSRRDKDIIRLAALGNSDKQIASQLGIATNTVKQYFRLCRQKVGNFDRLMLPGIALLLRLASIADICGPALSLLQDLTPDDNPEGFHEGAD